MSRIRQAEKPYLRTDLPEVAVGDTVHVAVRIKEGDRERVQVFTGTVIKIRGGGLGRTFTVRRIVQGEGVERVFPFHSPVIESIKITSKGRVRRAKLYYLRQRVGKATRLREVLGPKRSRRRAAAPSKGPKADEKAATENASDEPVEQAASTSKS